MVNLNIRIDEKLKEDAENILARLGLTASDAIRLFFAQIRNTRSIPFELKLYEEPNEELQSAMKRADAYAKGQDKVLFKSHQTLADLKADVEKND